MKSVFIVDMVLGSKPIRVGTVASYTTALEIQRRNHFTEITECVEVGKDRWIPLNYYIEEWIINE